MKFLIAMSALFLTACDGYGNAESHNIHLGDILTVKKGFYKDCRGVATDYADHDSYKDQVTIRNVTCPKATADYLTLNAEDFD